MTATLTTAAVHTQEAGNPEAPLLLCLHGIGSSSAAFAPQLAGLSDQVRVVAWDAPGYAASADPGRAPGLDGYADTAAALIRDRGGRAHVLGVSWGGVIALRLAARHPDLVESLIVADSSRGSGTNPDKAAAMRARAAQLAAEGPDAFAAARGPRLVSADAPAELVERVVATMAASIRTPDTATPPTRWPRPISPTTCPPSPHRPWSSAASRTPSPEPRSPKPSRAASPSPCT